MLAVISCGGVVGALARYGVGKAFPHQPGEMPWATLGVNATGCLAMGVLMALISEVWTGQRLLRPFLGVGVLGGCTTFSTHVVDLQQAIAVGRPHLAFAYLALTVLAAMAGVLAGSALTRRLVRAVKPA
ncbi:fluoride efflux transporter FluC [Saccharopolyspora rhizosphaerae]|uniref:fluoride efflux transporter FluC n=1 Tax=Saccharopolyspora rhizosphaerae TaxID=2492662 RepID=UPI002D775193|nr:CrcB family protein [Saccharopolyspora rhizosphaerae]